MKAERFEATPEFQHFKTVMKRVLAIPKERLDELVGKSKVLSSRNGDPDAPGRKRIMKRRKSKQPKP